VHTALPMPDTARLSPPAPPDPRDIPVAALAAGAAILAIIGLAAAHAYPLFDDAFITYRYARNLADGVGLVWNPAEPTEGYTNFLLVVLLAPFLAVGLDPLPVARTLNMLALAGMSGMVFHYTRAYLGASAASALLVASVLPLLANGVRIAMLGMETVLYTFALALAFLFIVQFLEHGRTRDLRLFFIIQFLALLLRPEGILLTAAFGLVLLATTATGRRPVGATTRAVLPSFLFFLAFPLVAYLAWKLSYYGHLLPNSFHLKVDGTGLLASGAGAVGGYFLHNKALLFVAIVSLLALRRGHGQHSAVAAVFVGLYAVFYLTVDTLMNPGNRFLYPITPFVFLLAAPMLVRGAVALRTLSANAALRLTVVGLAVLILVPLLLSDVQRGYLMLLSDSRQDTGVVSKRLDVAHALSEYPGIRDVTIALHDAGVVPYVTGSRVVDMVGLNNSYIARERDYDNLVRYLFDRDITLMFHGTMQDFTPITWGHGMLGKMDRWVQNPHARWQDFEYVGTVIMPAGHDFQLLLSRDYPHFEVLKSFLQERVIDVFQADFDPPGLIPGAGAHRPSQPARSDPAAASAAHPDRPTRLADRIP
jgi:arabinofuranosyltransferase